MSYLMMGGYSMWAVLVCGLVVAAVCLRLLLRRGDRSTAGDAIMFWGTAALAIGFIGTLMGVSNVAAAMAAAGPAAPTGIAWDGIRIALSTTIAGSAVFLLSLACWWLVSMRPASKAAE